MAVEDMTTRERAATPDETAREESPHLPFPASAAIFTAATIAVILLLVLFD
jgi:hypothetical protein